MIAGTSLHFSRTKELCLSSTIVLRIPVLHFSFSTFLFLFSAGPRLLDHDILPILQRNNKALLPMIPQIDRSNPQFFPSFSLLVSAGLRPK